MGILPPIFLLSTHLPLPDLHDLEDRIVAQRAPLTYNVHEARLFLGKIGTTQRAEFELRSRGLWTDQVSRDESGRTSAKAKTQRLEKSSRKRRKLDTSDPDLPSNKVVNLVSDSSSNSEEDGGTARSSNPARASAGAANMLQTLEGSKATTKVIKLDWFYDSLADGHLLDLEPYLVYEGRLIDRPKNAPNRHEFSQTRPTRKSPTLKKGEFKAIIDRAKAEGAPKTAWPGASHYIRARGPQNTAGADKSYASSSQGGNQSITRPTKLTRQSTSEYDEGVNSDIPEMPLWVKLGLQYACQRPCPINPPNEAFIDPLKKIKLARLLTGDEIGVRAYSTSIAALAAYPYTLSNTREILALPGCDTKVAQLYHEWKSNEGRIKAVEDVENDQALKVLRVFYEIWGVGAHTAREFYGKGWRDLDDVVEYGWDSLSRVQQIGVKYYDEFLQKIQRQEVEFIAAKVLEHAKAVRDDGIECCIVGGYRRGKKGSGDVDIILSHRDESQTLGLAHDVVASLEQEGWVTHTLLLTLTNTKRGQQPLAFRAGGGGHGFDTLDKGLVVWQDLHVPSEHVDGSLEAPAKNPNIHRRVDIIISPWRTVGCAIAGWSGGTTFQRDLRRYANKVKSWKFDSSGIRSRVTGEFVDLEAVGGVSKTWLEAEKKVFAGLGLEYREPWERCTG